MPARRERPARRRQRGRARWASWFIRRPPGKSSNRVHRVEARADRIADPWGERTPYGPGGEWPERVDVQLAEELTEGEVDSWHRSASVLHSNGDALDIAVKDGRIVGVRGRADDRVNHGRLGPKDLFGWQANNSPDRLTRPLVRRDGELAEASWDDAMDAVVRRSKELLELIARAGIGTNHLDGNTRLCTATAAEALKETFGCDGQPGSYTDIDHADTIVHYGHNVAETQAVLWQRVLDRRGGPYPPTLICVDPRRTPVAEEADLHLAPLPGTNLMLMNALLHELVANDWIDRPFVTQHAVGLDELVAAVADHPA